MTSSAITSLLLSLTTVLSGLSAQINGLQVSPTTQVAQVVSSPSSLPLIQSANLTRQGSFTIPNMADVETHWTGQRLGCEYVQGTIAFNPANNSLFIVCHDWSQSVAEISIPTLGGAASQLQQPRQVADLGSINPGAGDSKIGGLFVSNDKLLIGAYTFYDAAASATGSHFLRATNLTGSVQGPVAIGGQVGFTGGYMSAIPTEWQSLLGGTMLTGNCCLSIISRTSLGPSATVFSPNLTNLASQTSAVRVVGYTLDHHTLGDCGEANKLFNCATYVKGVVFVPGTRSVLFFGTLGVGNICYKDDGAVSCRGTGGFNTDSYVPFVWAYDANDFVAVKNGTKQPWEVVPYATWQLSGFSVGSNGVSGLAYDPATNRLFITERYGDGAKPRIHVYTISGGTQSTPSSGGVSSDAVLSSWSVWSDTSSWSACVNGSQTKTQTRTRTVITAAQNGGTTGALSETQTVSQSCTGTSSVITLSPSTISFVGVQGGAVPASISMKVTTSDGSSWSSKDTCSFFNAVPTMGASGGSHTLSPSTGWGSLPLGTTTCPIVYTSGSASVTVNAVAVVKSASTPTPVDATLSSWSSWSATTTWSACVSGTQTRTETRTRTVVTPATNGGTTGALSETRTATQTCTLPPVDAVVSAWSAWNDTTIWSACVNGVQTKNQQRTRTVVTPATNGGSTPALSETQTVSQSCTTSTTTQKLTQDLRLGSRGTQVTILQNFLIKKGYLKSGLNTGYFGYSTYNAVRSYQRANGISATGYVGSQTRAKINAEF